MTKPKPQQALTCENITIYPSDSSADNGRGRQEPLIKGVCLSATQGEMLGLIGPNGAGKSTLLRALAGLTSSVSDNVRINGQALSGLSHKQRARMLAYLPQQEVPAWPLSVEHLVGLGRVPWSKPLQSFTQQDHAAVEQAMTMTEVASLRLRSVGTLSGGELRRVQLARVLSTQTPLILADEPVTALDPYHQLQVMEVLRDCAREGCVVIALHELGLAARFCHRLVMLHRGEVWAQGSPEEVLSGKNLREVYGVSAEIVRTDGGLSVIPIGRV